MGFSLALHTRGGIRRLNYEEVHVAGRCELGGGAKGIQAGTNTGGQRVENHV